MLFIFGMIAGAALMGLVLFLSMKGIAVRWYEWLLGALGLVLAVWAVNDFFASIAEHNEAAGRTLLWILGIPAVILLALAVFLPWRRTGKSKAVAAESAK
jgi:uncharacterized membrane protein